jgi:hypothetical protein
MPTSAGTLWLSIEKEIRNDEEEDQNTETLSTVYLGYKRIARFGVCSSAARQSSGPNRVG